MTNDQHIIRARLAARLHDPAEKALILMRTSAGHEGGTSAALMTELLGSAAVPADVRGAVRMADHWASAADRAAFPNARDDGRFPQWQRVRFDEDPVVIHPLTGEDFRLRGGLSDVTPDQIASLALHHFRSLIQQQDGHTDLGRTAAAFWRFGPEIRAPEIENLWRLLPADTRVPDHTIWDHLDLVSALAGSLAADPEQGPALLAVTLGPVQDFIAASRSTSDLWAGSHLLSRLAWEAMRVVCEAFGPEAIIFPRLRGLPQVDVWLRDEIGLPGALFESCDWTSRRTDDNPLFAATLPNRFTAIVPAGCARDIAERITDSVRRFARERAFDAYRLLLDKAGIDDHPDLPGYEQIRTQLAGFPEVHWAAVPWSLVPRRADGTVDADDGGLADAMRPFFGNEKAPGYLGSTAWQLLSRGLELEKGWFYQPNPGALYPALHELLERVVAATKASRTFGPLAQEGWRCSLTGEAEWITTDRRQLAKSYRQQSETLWAKVSRAMPSWARPGEHLGAMAMLKRMWPVLFVREMRPIIGEQLSRYVVSTHTMALAAPLSAALDSGTSIPSSLRKSIESDGADRVALPRQISRRLLQGATDDYRALAHIPGWLERLAQQDDGAERYERARRELADFLGAPIETYYAMLMMDGDSMGAWMSASPRMTPAISTSLHPQIRQALGRFEGDPALARYLGEKRAPNPAWHMAISDALNQFALELAPAIVEGRFNGKLIYAGGDDVLAMLPAAEVMNAADALRRAFCGIAGEDDELADATDAAGKTARGFAMTRRGLVRTMGSSASASCGIVIAHHQAPLASVMRELHAAERRAKTLGRRAAWSISLIKRSGGTSQLTGKWDPAMRTLDRLRAFLADDTVSRRAVYNTLEWLKDMPDKAPELLASMLAYQLRRQSGKEGVRRHDVDQISADLVGNAFDDVCRPSGASPERWLRDALVVAEFLARESRSAPALPSRKVAA